MQRFLTPASGSNDAVPPVSSQADAPHTEAPSAEKPGFQMHAIRDVQRWLAEEHIASCSGADVQRIREAVAVLSRPKPRQEDVQPLQSKWQVAQQKDKKRRPLDDVLHEFQGKVIKAAQKLQLELSGSAEQPAASTVGQPASMNTADSVHCDDEPWLAELRANQRKRALASAAEERMENAQQRPQAKPKPANKQKKRTASRTFGSVEQPASKRQNQCLTSELFAANARDLSDPIAASSSNAVQPSTVQQQSQRMGRLLHELKKLSEYGWAVDDAKDALKEMISQASDLQQIPPTQDVLRKPSIRVLYSSICGALQPTTQLEQNRTQVWLTACYSLEDNVIQFVQARQEIEEDSKETYCCLWQLKNRLHDAVLNSLPDMPRSLHEFIQGLNDSGASTHTPFGRLPREAQVKPSFSSPLWYFSRMLVSVELPRHRFVDMPIANNHAELIDKVVQHRSNAAKASAAQPALITAGDVKEVLQDFCTDPFSSHANKRWLLDVLKVPKANRQDPEYLPQMFEAAVDEFLQDVSGIRRTLFALSKHTLAVLALYHRILITWKPRSRGTMLLGPIFRMLSNSEGTSRKQYLPEDMCGEDVELAANRMPAYWMRLQDSAEQPVDDLSLPVASPPVMCWICGEGFLHNGALFKHCCTAHGDYAEYRKRLFWRAMKDGFKPLLPWVKRHMLESATFHLTYSVPGSFSLKWSHPESFLVAKERSEVACVVCARKDWLESGFTV